MRVRLNAVTAAAIARRQGLRPKLFFAPRPASSTRVALIPAEGEPVNSVSSSVSPVLPEKSPRESSFFRRPPEAVSMLCASSASSPSSKIPRTRQSTFSVANPLAQTSKCILYLFLRTAPRLRRGVVVIYLSASRNAERALLVDSCIGHGCMQGPKCNPKPAGVMAVLNESHRLGKILGRYILREVLLASLVVTTV